jgi:hypothetical protein
MRDLRATSHTRLRARDHYTSSTLIGGKGGSGPSLLLTTLVGPTEHVNARMDGKVHVDSYGASNEHVSWSLGLFSQKPPLGGRSNTKPGDHGTPNVHNR